MPSASLKPVYLGIEEMGSYVHVESWDMRVAKDCWEWTQIATIKLTCKYTWAHRHTHKETLSFAPLTHNSIVSFCYLTPALVDSSQFPHHFKTFHKSWYNQPGTLPLGLRQFWLSKPRGEASYGALTCLHQIESGCFHGIWIVLYFVSCYVYNSGLEYRQNLYLGWECSD